MSINLYCLLVALLAVAAAFYSALAQLIPFEMSPKAASAVQFGVVAFCFLNAILIYQSNKTKLDPLGWSGGVRGKQGSRRVFLILLSIVAGAWFVSSVSVKAILTFREDEPPMFSARDIYSLTQNKSERIAVDYPTFLIVGGSQIGLGWAATLFIVSLIVRMGLDLYQATRDEANCDRAG